MSRDNQLKKLLQNGSLRGIIFDFDGTLLDISEPLRKSIEEVYEEKKRRKKDRIISKTKQGIREVSFLDQSDEEIEK